jgi:hypothetical protein
MQNCQVSDIHPHAAKRDSVNVNMRNQGANYRMSTQPREFDTRQNRIMRYANIGTLTLGHQRWAVLVCNSALYSQKGMFRKVWIPYWKLAWRLTCLSADHTCILSKVRDDGEMGDARRTENDESDEMAGVCKLPNMYTSYQVNIESH